MRMKRIVTAMLAGCAAVVMAAVPELSAQTPQDHQHAATDKAKPRRNRPGASKPAVAVSDEERVAAGFPG